MSTYEGDWDMWSGDEVGEPSYYDTDFAAYLAEEWGDYSWGYDD